MAKKTSEDNNNIQRNGPLQIPAKLLNPIGSFLRNQLQTLEKRRASLEKDDPFVSGRAENNASPDTGAAEQFGHARIEAIRKEMDKRIVQMRKALTRVKLGNYGTCEECGQLIDTDRLVIFPDATLCISCEKKKEK